MKNTSTQPFPSVARGLALPAQCGVKLGQHQYWLYLFLVFVLVCSNALISKAQVTYPTLTRFAKPSPEPAAPGDAFTPPMGGSASTSAPQAAEWTRTAGPNESIVLTGVNLSRYSGNDEGKDSRFLVYSRNGLQKEARIQRVEADKAIITLPHDLTSWSMYLIWPGNEAGYGSPIAINKTDAWWVGPDKATRGQTISVFGRNLTQNNDTLRAYVYIKPVGGSGQWATIGQVNPYKVDFTVPAGLANGEYEVWAHNGHGGQYGWSGPLKLNIYDGPQWTTTTFNVKNYGATGNGYTDDTEAVKRAMQAARSSANATVYFPTGVYMMSTNLQAYSNMQLKGDGPAKTILRCATNYSTSAMGLIFGSVQNFAITDMGFEGNRNFRGSLDKPIFLRGSSDVWITNARFSFAGNNVMDLHSCRYIYLNRTEHIGISTFLGDCSQLFIDRNVLKLTNDSDMALHSWSGSGISMTRTTCRDLDNSNPFDGSGWGKGRVFTGNGTWGSNRNTYLGNNITTDLTPRPAADVDQNSGEQFLWEGNLGQWAGFVSSATATTTTLPGYSYNAPDKQYAVIVKGKGLGQSRRVVANNGGTVTLNEPWNVIPDASSYIVVGHFIDRIAVYNNYLDGKPRAVTSPDHIAAAGIEPFGGALNFVAANNTLHELRQGVANWSTQHTTGLDPNFFSLYTGNKMINCRWGIYNQLILTRPEGTTVLGTTYRNNNITGATVAGVHTSVSTAASNSLDAEVYEHNSFSNTPQGLTSAVFGVTNQLFYKNTFSGIGGAGLTITPKMALRENAYQGVSTLYKGGLQGTTIEAPLHVIDMAGIAGGSVVTTDFTLKNSTISAMNWVATSSASWLTFSTNSGSIPDEGCVNMIALNANPAGLPLGTHTATITVTVADQIKKYTVSLKLTTPQNGVNITAPTANQAFSAAEPINITATATDANGTITKVEFFAGSTKVGEDLTSPYSFSWTNAPAGNHVLVAKATNGAGVVTSSAPVNITVSANAAPVVSLTSPANAASFAAPASITITANAADTDGTVSKVEFFNGTTKIGEDLTSPYTINWYNVAVGSYVITAKATDNAGTVTTSAPVILNTLKNNNPTVTLASPGNNVSLKAPTNVYILANAELTDGNISKVEFFNGTTKLNEKTTAPYEMYWMNLPVGTYTVTAKATGSNGATATSAPVRISIVSSITPINSAPTVSISSPATNSNFAAPANIVINTTAADADGSVSKVEFFNGSIKIGESLTSPFSFTWNNVTAGSYSLTAVATDNAGTSTTSAPVVVNVKTANTTSNTAPTVNITAPANGTSVAAPATLNITANATDTDGTVSKVEFFNGATKLGEDLTAPYSFTWSNVAAGTYTLTAKATDNTGATTTSASVNISVNAPAVLPVAPTVALTSPNNSAVFMTPLNLSLTATAADTDGTITKVEFYNGTTKLGEDLTAPYSFAWNTVAAGTYTLTAKAYDNSGLSTTSAPVNITVKTPVAPTVAITAPTTGNSFTAPATVAIAANAADVDGSVVKVEFYNGTTKLGEDLTAPYTFNWANVTAGTYSLTAKAYDNTDLTTTSTVVNITVNNLVAPNVNITSPVANAGFNAPASITIAANATDNDGTVSKVEFFSGATKLGEDFTAPYSFTWSNVTAGTYSLTAKATDNNDLTTTSAAISISVAQPAAPTVALTSPNNGAVFMTPLNLSLTATAADTDGTITKVEFYNGSTKLGEDLTAPYSFAWNTVAAGTYTLTAKAYDNAGLSTTSTPVNITVKTPVAPTVAITAPTTGNSFTAPATVAIAASAADVDGTIVKVEFYNGTTKIGEDLSSPYTFNWANVAAGTYSLTAKAYDNTGLTTTSSAVSIAVRTASAPTVAITTPGTGSSFTSPASVNITANASDADGSVTKVEFYNGTTKLGEDLTAPYSFTWNNITAGTYTLTAKAYDNSSLVTTSTAVIINVKAPVAPTVTITSPVNATEFTAPANISIVAAAADADGTVSKVEFYQGSTLLGTASASPYSIAWNNVAAGTYTLTAKAYDNTGLTTTSSTVNITVSTSNGQGVPVVNITSPVNNTTFNNLASILININIGNAVGTIQKVEFFANNNKIGEDLSNPFTLNWTNVPAGTYTLTAKATNKWGQVGISSAVSIVVSGPSYADKNAGLIGTGGISWEYWSNVPGWHGVNQIPVNTTPANTRILDSFATPENIGNNYGARVRGYVVAPTTGEYTFYISGDDQGDLFLSTSEDPSRKAMIAYLSRPTSVNVFTNHASQQSRPVTLVAGQRYYIEALHKEGTGNDHLSVGWKLPNGTVQGPIEGRYLMPYNNTPVVLSAINQTTSKNNNAEAEVTNKISAYPNPTQDRATIEFTFTKAEDYKLQIFDLKGILIKTLQTGKARANETIKVTWDAGNLPKGIYNATLITSGTKQTSRIVLQ